MSSKKGVQHVHRNRHKLSVAWRKDPFTVLRFEVGNAAVPGTHIMSIRISGGEIKVVRRIALAPYRSMMRIGICVPFLPGSCLSVNL